MNIQATLNDAQELSPAEFRNNVLSSNPTVYNCGESAKDNFNEQSFANSAYTNLNTPNIALDNSNGR